MSFFTLRRDMHSFILFGTLFQALAASFMKVFFDKLQNPFSISRPDVSALVTCGTQVLKQGLEMAVGGFWGSLKSSDNYWPMARFLSRIATARASSSLTEPGQYPYGSKKKLSLRTQISGLTEPYRTGVVPLQLNFF